MRTFDKLIATIFAHQRAEHLRPLSGVLVVGTPVFNRCGGRAALAQAAA